MKRFNLKTNKGLIVVNVLRNSAGDEAGVRAGDVIERVAQTEVSSVEQLQREINKILRNQTGDEKVFSLYILSRGERRSVAVVVTK